MGEIEQPIQSLIQGDKESLFKWCFSRCYQAFNVIYEYEQKKLGAFWRLDERYSGTTAYVALRDVGQSTRFSSSAMRSSMAFPPTIGRAKTSNHRNRQPSVNGIGS